MKLYLTTDSGSRKHIDMTASWGNDHALVTVVQPQPMKFSMDFSVSTTGQSGTVSTYCWSGCFVNHGYTFTAYINTYNAISLHCFTFSYLCQSICLP